MHHGLTRLNVRQFAFEIAKMNQLKVPSTWHEKKIMGKDWYYSYMKRFPDLSIRKAEGTSLARAMAFNRTTVNEFYDNLETVMNKFKFQPSDIYNLDETGATTVQRPPNVIAPKGTHRWAK